MADPLSIAAGVVGVITVAGQISSLLTKYAKKAKDAPSQAHVILTEITDISRILSHLQTFVLDTDTVSSSRTCLLHIESVVAIVTGCVATFSELQRLLDSLRTDEMTVIDRVKWMKEEAPIGALRERLQTHKASLSLMLDVLNGNTMQEMKGTVDRLDATIASHYEDILKRVQALEKGQESERTRPPPSAEPPKSRWSTGTVSEEVSSRVDDPGKKRSSRLFNFIFEQDLSASWVYRNIAFQGSHMSLLSTDQPASRWSTFSGTTVADMVSQMSVYSLAITPAEIYNPQQYIVNTPKQSPTSRLRAALSRRRSKEITLLQQPWLRSMGRSHIVRELCRDTGSSVNDSCLDVLYLVLKVYLNHSLPAKFTFRKSSTYSLCVIHGDQEHCFGSDELPLEVFDDLESNGHKPIFMIRKHDIPASGSNYLKTAELVGILKEGWWIDQDMFVEILPTTPEVLESTAMIFKLPSTQPYSSSVLYSDEPDPYSYMIGKSPKFPKKKKSTTNYAPTSPRQTNQEWDKVRRNLRPISY